MHAQLDGMHTRGGDSIKHKKRLLITAAVGAAIILSAVLIVSLSGDDKPGIETNPPPADIQPGPTQDTSDDGSATPAVTPEPEEDDDGVDKPKPKPRPGNGGGNGNGDDGSDSPAASGKKHGLERAIEVHLRNMEKQADKKGGSADTGASADDGKGLENSLMHLQKNLEKQNASMDDVSEDLGGGHGQGKATGNPHNT